MVYLFLYQYKHCFTNKYVIHNKEFPERYGISKETADMIVFIVKKICYICFYSNANDKLQIISECTTIDSQSKRVF